MTGTTTLQVVYDLLKNTRMVLDGAHHQPVHSLRSTKHSLSHLDRSVLMDDIRRTLGVFCLLEYVVAVDSGGSGHATSLKQHE